MWFCSFSIPCSIRLHRSCLLYTSFSEEVVWFPKTTSDPDYHYEGIVSDLMAAAEHMPRVDAVGVSSAGIYIENRTMVASLLLKVSKEDFDAKVKDIYIRAIRDTFGDRKRLTFFARPYIILEKTQTKR